MLMDLEILVDVLRDQRIGFVNGVCNGVGHVVCPVILFRCAVVRRHSRYLGKVCAKALKLWRAPKQMRCHPRRG